MIVAMNEPRGEGNGWEPCNDDAPGVVFYIDNGGCITAAYDTRAEAEEAERDA